MARQLNQLTLAMQTLVKGLDEEGEDENNGLEEQGTTPETRN